MPEHSRNYIMHAAKSAHGTFSRPRAIPTYLPTLASDRALQKLYAMLPTFQICFRIETFQTVSNYLRLHTLYFHYALRSRCRKRSFFNIF